MHWASNGMDNIHVHITKTINYVVLMNMYTVIAVYCKHAIANMRQKHVHKTVKPSQYNLFTEQGLLI